MNLSTILAVAAGGALGSTARYVSMSVLGGWIGTGFPYGTLFVNIAGSFVMGVLAELGALAWQPGPDLRAFIAVGILGGFTTFSTFSLDVALMVEKHGWSAAALYITLSVGLSVGALFLGMAAVRQVVA